MKKLLLSFAVAALAIPSASAVTIDDILGTYTGTYKGWDPQDNWTEYDGVYNDVIIEAGDYDDEVIIKHLFPKKFPELNVVAIFDGYSLYIEEQYLDDDYSYYLTTYDNATSTFVVPVIFTLGEGTIELPDNYDLYIVPAASVNDYLDNIGQIKLHKGDAGEPDGPENPDDVTIDDLLGTYTGTYKGWDPQDNWTEYDGVYNDVIIEAGDYDDEVIIKHLFPKKFPELNVVAIFDGYSLYIEEQYLDDDYSYYLTTYDNATSTFVVPVIFTLGKDTIELPDNYDLYIVPAASVNDYLDNIGQIKLHKGDAGVDGISISDNSTPIYYDLQGRKVENPSNGIYIRKQGKETNKVILK